MNEYELIKTWDASDLHGLMNFVGKLWMSDSRWARVGSTYSICTEGWPGNEEIIGAMRQNVLWWENWAQSEHGGRYVFSNISDFDELSLE
jgi:hypothetical protein